MGYGSSFNGHIEDIPDIYVDNFEHTNKKAYFLSHCHTDHTQGLFKYKLMKDMAKNGAKIYMTEASMKIVTYTAEKFNNYEISDYIQPLKLGTTTVTIDDNLHIEVTLIPAGHCLGSVMFLFRIKNKTILYTGDFRIRQNDIQKYAQFHDKHGEPIKIDVMYLDTTFLHQDYSDFAKRSDSVDVMIQEVGVWLKLDPKNRVAIHTSANYAYEFVFNKIYKQLGHKVSVDDDIWELYKHFPDLLPALAKEKDPKIHLCRPIKYKWHCEHNNQTENNYLSVHFSAQSWSKFDDDQKACKDYGLDTIKVCFATHCSRSELLYFVSYFEPSKVIGFPNPYNPSVQEISYEDRYLPSPKKKKVMMMEEPKEKRNVDRKLLEEMFR